MRCPKCGYISFDHLETCRKCEKYIGDTVTEVNGTVYDAFAPSFLQLTTGERFHAQPSFPQRTDKPDETEDSESDTAVREGIDTEFVLNDEGIAWANDSEELVMDLDDFSEVAPREEYTLDLSKESSRVESSQPSLDFGDLDISDLAPPVKEQFEPPSLEEELEAVDIEPVAVLSQNLPPQQKPSPARSTGLEDLLVNGLNLEAPARFVAGSAAGKRYYPSIKTGTALDKFDVDLGELFTENKK